MTKERTLAERIIAVAEKLGAIGKDKKNAHFGYNYASAEKFIEAVREPMLEEGLILIPNFAADWADTAKGHTARLQARYTITDGKEEISASVCGEGVDNGDKSIYKAMTGAHKYMLRLLFNLPMVDDPEAGLGLLGHEDIVGHSHLRKEIELLINYIYAGHPGLLRRFPGHLPAVEGDGPGFGPVDPGDDLDQG